MDKKFMICILVGIVFSCVAICYTTHEVCETNKIAIKNGLVRQYDSNVSGWVKP